MHLEKYIVIVLLVVAAYLVAATSGKAVSGSKTKDGKISKKCAKAILKAVRKYGQEFVEEFFDSEEDVDTSQVRYLLINRLLSCWRKIKLSHNFHIA